MDRPPRRRGVGVLDRPLLRRAWLLLGDVSAVVVMGGYLYTLMRAGGHAGDPTGPGTALRHACLQATTITFAGSSPAKSAPHSPPAPIGRRCHHRPVHQPAAALGILFELVFTAAVICAPPMQHIFGIASLNWRSSFRFRSSSGASTNSPAGSPDAATQAERSSPRPHPGGVTHAIRWR
jgi:hypothetical protein